MSVVNPFSLFPQYENGATFTSIVDYSLETEENLKLYNNVSGAGVYGFGGSAYTRRCQF